MNVRQFFHRATQAKALAAIALLGVAGMAHAGGNVSWSVGVNAPIIPGPGHVNAVVSGGPGYYYPPQPVYVQPRVVVPRPYYGYGVQPVVYQAPPPRFRPMPGWAGRWHRHGRAEAYANGYRQGYERGYDRGNDQGDDRRGGGWHHHHGR